MTPKQQSTGASRSSLGTRAPRIAGLLALTLSAFACTAGSALAAAPEAPKTEKATAITATTATLEGTLNPGADAKAGWYFAYSTEISCMVGPLTTPTEPEEEVQAKTEKAAVTGLEPRKQYEFCMFATNEAGEATPSEEEVSFTTPAALPAVLGESTSAVSSTGATLEAVLNPNNQATATTYSFEYATAGKTGAGEKLEGTIVKLAGGEFPPEAFGETPVGVPTGTVLKAGATYFYRVIAKNGASEETKGNVATFTTVPTPTTEAPSPIGSSTATFKGKLAPLNPAVKTEDFFSYNTGETSACTNESATSPDEEAGIGAGTTKAVSTAVTGLQPNQKYTVCLVSVNVFGSEEDPKSLPVHFTTKPAPPTVETVAASSVKATTVTLEGKVNPNNEPTECEFSYGTLSVEEHTIACTPELLKGYGGQSVSSNRLNEKEEVTRSITGLSASTLYKYRILAKSGAGAGTGEGTFTTGPLPETPQATAASGITGVSAKLEGLLNPAGKGEPGTYEFLYKQSSGECALSEGELAQPEIYTQKVAPSPPAESPLLGTPEAVSVPVSGLLPGTEYTFCLRASNEAGETITGEPVTFTTTAVGLEDSPSVAATEVLLTAEIGTDDAETTYEIQYGTTNIEEHTIPTPEATVTPSTTPTQVQQTLTGLTPATTYKFRFQANNGHGPTTGEERTFTTPAATVSEPPETCPNAARRTEQPDSRDLPDCRAYEMVSPAQTGGADATETFPLGGEVRAAAEGAAITYSAYGLFGEPVGGQLEDQLLSRRNAKEGRWETRSIVAPSEHPNSEAPLGYVGVFFSPQLTQGLTTTAAAGLSSEAPEGLQELYLVGLKDGPGPYQLVSNLPGTQEEKEYAHPYQIGPGVYPLGASSDLTHVVFATENGGIGPLREWVTGRVVIVGVSNEGEVWTEAEVGPEHTPGGLESGLADVWRAVSEDGSRVIFTRDNGELYARVNVGVEALPEPEREQSDLNAQKECIEPAKACTVKLSAGAAQYVGASTNDSKIFYLENNDLYEYELPIGAVKGQARALTSGDKVQGVVQISEDGSYVYFVAGEALKNEHGETLKNISGVAPSPGADNLYMSHEGKPAFIATLSAGDGSDWQPGPGDDSSVLAPGAAGGARLAFTSDAGLTGYDNRDAVSGQPDTEVYLYDAETGALVCASCNPNGARPAGSASLTIGRYSGESSGIAPSSSNYRPRDLLADGELFFDSRDALTAHSSGGVQSVYEYEDGHVYPISNPAGGHDSRFLDASADGTDVFFATADQLLPQDTSTNVVVYDARAGGGFPASTVTPPCTTGESCMPPASPEPGIYGPAPSATVSGPGDVTPSPQPPPKHKTAAQVRAEKLARALKACRRKHNKHKRQVCEKQARKKYGAKTSKASAKKSATRAINDGRAGR